MKTGFLLDHSLFLWQTKGMLQKTQSPGWNEEAAKDRNTYAQDSTEGGLHISLPSTSSVQLCNILHCLVAADVHTGVPQSLFIHAGLPFSATSSPTSLMQERLYHPWAHTLSQETRRERASSVFQGSRSLNCIERMIKHCKGISAILISPNFCKRQQGPFNKMGTVAEICFVKCSEIYSCQSWSRQVCYREEEFVMLFLSIRLVTIPGD